MAAIGFPSSIPKDWITPDEQFKRIGNSTKEKVKNIIEGSSGLISVLATVVVEYLGGSVMPWYGALENINMLPSKIPPLPPNFEKIYYGPCPIGGDKVKDSHSLYLVVPESLTKFLECANDYRQKDLTESRDKNPFRLSGIGSEYYVNTQLDKPYWILISQQVLKTSIGKFYSEQTKMVADLGPGYKIPCLREVVVFSILHKIATGETVLQEEDGQYADRRYATRIQESHYDCRLGIGNTLNHGMETCCADDDFRGMGVLAVRML